MRNAVANVLTSKAAESKAPFASQQTPEIKQEPKKPKAERVKKEKKEKSKEELEQKKLQRDCQQILILEPSCFCFWNWTEFQNLPL